MSNRADGIDASFKFPSEAGLRAWKASGGQVVSSYLSPGTSGKNWTPERLRLVHSIGLGAELNFEWYAGRAREGYNAGVADGVLAAREFAALQAGVGYRPRSRIIIPLSADFDATAADLPEIDDYLRGAQKGLANVADAGVYGEYDVVVHTAAAGASHMEWQTYAWSNGKFAAGVTDFYQWRNSQQLGGAPVDYDQVINAAKLGAWWPPGHPLDVAPNSTKPAVSYLEELMALDPNSPDYKRLVSDVADAVWAKQLTFASGTKNAITANAAIWLMYSNRYALGGLSRMAQAFKQAVTK